MARLFMFVAAFYLYHFTDGCILTGLGITDDVIRQSWEGSLSKFRYSLFVY